MSVTEQNETWKTWWPDLYQKYDEPRQYPGSSDSYRKAGWFLSGPGRVEEWGCATTFGKQFIDSPYRGVDGAPSQWVDEVADLSTYRSTTPKILIRHVLEHNWNWRDILDNVMASFTDRAVVILFIPTGKHDINRSFEHRSDAKETPPGLQLDRISFLSKLYQAGVVVESEELTNDTPPFGYEQLWYLTKDESAAGYIRTPPYCTMQGCVEPGTEHPREGTDLIRADIVALSDRYQQQILVCSECIKEFHTDLYSLSWEPRWR